MGLRIGNSARVPAIAAAIALGLALFPATSAFAQVADDVKVAGSAATGGFPEDLFVRVVSPPEYVRGCCQDGTSGEWLGPDYQTSDGETVGPSAIEWSVIFDDEATSPAMAARRDQFQGWPEVESAAIQVKRYENDQVVQELPGHFIVSKNDAPDAADYEASVAVELGGGVFAAAGFTVIDPAYNDLKVKRTIPADKWNSDQIHIAINSMALIGPLPTFGTEGDDEVQGTNKDDVIVLGKGNDKSNGDDGNDKLNGQAGNDIVEGGLGNDRVVGGAGNDKLYGDNALGSGGGAARRYTAAQDLNDVVLGGGGKDLVSGGGGNDRLVGGPGLDVIKGGPGTDTCVFDRKEELKKSSECEKKARSF